MLQTLVQQLAIQIKIQNSSLQQLNLYMGNQLVGNKHLTIYQQKGQKNWTNIQTISYCFLVRHKQTDKLAQMYSKQTHNLIQQATSYQFRKDNGQYLVTALAMFKNSIQNICSQTSHFNVIIQRIPFRFADLGQISYYQAIYILNQSFRGFQLLRKKIATIHIEDTNICINNLGQCKVWINQNLSQNFPDQRANISEHQQVNQIFQLVQSKINQMEMQNHNYNSKKQQFQICDFKSAILFVQFLIKESGYRADSVKIPQCNMSTEIELSVLETMRKSQKKKSLSKNHSDLKFCYLKHENVNEPKMRPIISKSSMGKKPTFPNRNIRIQTQINNFSINSQKQQDQLTQQYTPKYIDQEHSLNKIHNKQGDIYIHQQNIKNNNQNKGLERTPSKKEVPNLKFKYQTQSKKNRPYQQFAIQRHSIYYSDLKQKKFQKPLRQTTVNKKNFNSNLKTSLFNQNINRPLFQIKKSNQNYPQIRFQKQVSQQQQEHTLKNQIQNLNKLYFKADRSQAIRQILNRPLIADKYFRK